MNKQSKSSNLASLAGKAYFEQFQVATKEAIQRLLQLGLSPEEIEAKMLAYIDLNYSHLSKWRREEFAAMYYLAADYAQKKNKHLD